MHEQHSHLTDEQLKKLDLPPTAADYNLRPDGKIYLKKDYFFRKANEIFGIGGWSAHHDAGSVRYETQLHPKTSEPVGVICYVQTTVSTRFSMPISVVGFAAVQFGKHNGAIRDDQQIDVYILALRAAEARGLKDALAYFGTAFQVDLKGGKKPQPTVARQTEERVETRQGGNNPKPVNSPVSKTPGNSSSTEPTTTVAAVRTAAGSEIISPEQLIRVKALAGEKGYSQESLEALCQQRMRRGSTEMSQAQATRLIEMLEKMPATVA
jgi:hypothetical protein